MKYIIYTDGACSGNPGPGGWGAVIIDEKENQINLSGKEKATTNNRMELVAPIMALKKIKNSSEITIYTDSTYLKNGITIWIENWKKNNWKNAKKKPVKNKDLWIQLDKLAKEHSIDWKWVRGHTGHPENEKADELANQGIDSLFK